MSDSPSLSPDPGQILRDTAAGYAGRIANLKNNIAANESSIKGWKNEIEGLEKALEIMNAQIEKLPKPKAPPAA